MAPRRPELSQWRNHLVRTATSGAICVMLAIDGATCRGTVLSHAWLIALGIVYPQISWYATRKDAKGRLAQLTFLIDGLFCGAVCGTLELSLVPSTALVTLSLFTLLLMGGVWFAVVGGLALILGIDMTMPFSSQSPTSRTCLPVDQFAALLIVVYFSTIAYLIFRQIQQLRIDRTRAEAEFSALEAAKQRAIAALLDLAPPGMRDLIRTGQSDVVIDSPDCAMFIARLGGGGTPECPSSMSLRVRSLCDIASRFNVEILKTFGPWIIGVARESGAVGDIVNFAREFTRHDRDHFGAPADSDVTRVIVHRGAVQYGIASPAHLHVELAGPSACWLYQVATVSWNGQAPMSILLTDTAWHSIFPGTTPADAIFVEGIGRPLYQYGG